MPFTHEQFLDLFGVYNSQLWTAAVALWLLSLVAVVEFFRRRLTVGAAAALLAAHWAWSGAVYHAIYFTRINPAAWLFAALFLVEAGLLLQHGRTHPGPIPVSARGGITRTGLADVFLLGGLAYPALVLLTGLTFPRAPLFAVPCPTVLLTAGLLLAMGPATPRLLSVIPVLWAMLGGYAAVAFGVWPDLVLFAAGLALIVAALAPGQRRHVIAHSAP